MRRPSPKPKRREETTLPDDLLAFLQEVGQRVEARDESTLIESDDLLQSESAYGGRDSEELSRFSFTYFPEPGVRREWVFAMEASELIAIAHGDRPTVQLWACAQANCRSKYQENEGPACFYCDWDDDSVADG